MLRGQSLTDLSPGSAPSPSPCSFSRWAPPRTLPRRPRPDWVKRPATRSSLARRSPTPAQAPSAATLASRRGLRSRAFRRGLVTNGSIHSADANAGQAESAVTTAYNALDAAPCNFDLTGQDLGGLTLTEGVYCFSSSAQLTGQLTLNAQGNASAVFIFEMGSTLTTASNASVQVINGGVDCNVFWQVGSSATIGTGTVFVGNILALTSISLTTGASVSGRALARNGAVTLDTNHVGFEACAVPTATPTAAPTPTPTATPSPTPVGETATPTPIGQTPSPVPTPTPVGQIPAPTPILRVRRRPIPRRCPTPTPVGQTPSPTPVGQTPSPTPTPTPVGQTPSPTPVGQTPSPTPDAFGPYTDAFEHAGRRDTHADNGGTDSNAK